MPGGPRMIFVSCRCPSCRKLYQAEIIRLDPPAREGKLYLMKCWQCSAVGKPQWIKDWVHSQKNWKQE